MKLSDATHCFAEPGEGHIIDIMRPDGSERSWYAYETLDEIRLRYPKAVVMLLEDWKQERIKEQDVPVIWTECTQEKFEEMLNCLPPALMGYGGFLVGEPWDHHFGNGQPRFSAYWEYHRKFYESSRPMTIAEFKDRSRDAIEKQLAEHNAAVIKRIFPGGTQQAAEVQEMIEREGMD